MRKKLFAVIMSVMMMVTFMPAMAFATSSLAEGTFVKWAPDYSSVKVTLSTGEWAEVESTRTYDATGFVKVKLAESEYTAAQLDNYSCSPAKMSALLADLNIVRTAQTNFNVLDLKNASIVYTSSGQNIALTQSASISKADFESLVSGTGFYGIRTVSPDYTLNLGQKATKTLVTKENAKTAGFELSLPTLKELGYEESTDDQPVTLPLYISAEGAYINGPVAANITVTGAPASLTNVKFYVDSVAKANEITGNATLLKTVGYNGAEHKVVMNQQKDISIESCEKYNWKTGGWEKVDTMTYKDANTAARPNVWNVTVKDSKGNTIQKTIKVNVEPVNLYINLSSYEKIEDSGNWFVDAYFGDEVNAENFLAYDVEKWNTVNNDVKAAKAAVKAEKKEIKAWFDKYFTLGVKKEGVDTVVYIEKKEDAPADLTTAQNKYSDNFVIDVEVEEAVVEFKIVQNDVTAYNQTRTFHVKNAKALKSKKTFQLKGDKTDYGTLSYTKKSGNSKITVSKTGKVTVKKGLKKGTYTVKIKVKAAGAKEIKTLKVKVVK